MADLDQALRLEPDEPDAVTLKADLLSSQGKHAEALALLDRISKTPIDEPHIARMRAVLLYKSGQTASARAAFAALESKAKTASDFNALCWTKATSDVLLDTAIEDCQQALKLSPGTGGYVDSLGMALLKLGRLDEALQAYNDAVAKNTGADSLMGRAFVYLHKGDRAHAEADAAAARKLSPEIDAVFAEYGLKFNPEEAKPRTSASN